MGQAKVKQYNRAEFLRRRPTCCYCGAQATTTDHCPPRGLFRERRWPEGYEFPCCAACNAKDRYHEQVISVLLKPSIIGPFRDEPWSRTVESLRASHPEIVDEWLGLSRNEVRRSLRKMFGDDRGDALRRAGWGAIQLGPLSNASLDEFALKLGQALFFKHIGRRCTGKIFALRVDAAKVQEAFNEILPTFPQTAETRRGNVELADAFTYSFNDGPDIGAFIGLVRCREQFTAMVIGVDEPFASQIVEKGALQGFIVRDCA